jgi:hypothetical protein
MSPPPSFDASIPVLTEVFKDQAAKLDPPRDAARGDDGNAEAGAMAAGTDADMEALERRLCERILQQLQGRVDFVLEQRLRDSMEEALQHAMAGLTGEIRRSLQQTIEKIVVRAVAQELAHLQTLKK